MANLYLQANTVNDRQRAAQMILKAIMIDPNNPEYRLTRGKIWWAQSFRFRALDQFKKVMKKHPKNTDVLNSLGMFLVYDFLSQKDRRAPLKEMDMGSRVRYYRLMAMRPRIKDFKIFAEEAKQEAVQVLRKSIELDGTNQQPYYFLGILYFEDENWYAFQTLMQDLYAQYP
ncbi:MAG: hypothetical protein J4F29_22080, partial [Candidatus Latescibacteria bacterium]|nr:hypothetical protein [Candidatus Latescibacterota bacterium]